MSRFLKTVSRKKGASPGTLVHIGDRKVEEPGIRVIQYNASDIITSELNDIVALSSMELNAEKIFWLNVSGVHDEKLIEAIGEKFSIHPLTMEDILHTNQRPKAELYESYMYIVLKTLDKITNYSTLADEQISFVVLPGGLISFQESAEELFSGVLDRLNRGKGRIRNFGSDYLAYALIDTVVDHYFSVLETLGQRIDALEEELTDSPQTDTMRRIHALRHEFIFLRKQIWPLREVINSLSKDESGLVKEKTRFYLRDVYDHTIQIIDTIETYRDILSGYLDLYLSIVSYKMNEVMKVLTIIATIFIPITFIAGVYGMNFKYMPELDWRWGYGGVWMVMLLSVMVMVSYFKKKRWW